MEAVIFDMDGVLVDSELQWRRVESSFLQKLVPTWSEQDQNGIIGMSIHDVYSNLQKKYGISLSKEEYIDQYKELSEKVYGEWSNLLPGALELLTSVLDARIPCALASSSPRSWIEIVLKRFALSKYFREVVSGDDVVGKGKPSPEIFLLTAKKLGLKPAKIVVIEDSEKGVRAALSAEMSCVGLRNGFNDEQDISSANLVVTSLSDLSIERLKVLSRS